MSDLVDRYLAAVAALLPKAQRQDIVAELRDMVMNRIEEAEARLGRPLDRRETEDLLREIGHPIAVAGRYGPHRALIGPELYPFWLVAVKVMLVIAAFAAVVPAGVLLATGHTDAHAFNGIFGDFVPTALSLIGAATLVGAAIERGWIKVGGLANWKASELPRVPEGKAWFAKSRFDGLFELAAIALFIAWWTGGLPFPMEKLVRAPDGVGVALSPVLVALHGPILALAVLQGVSALVLVVRPGWVRARASLELCCAAGGLLVSAVLWHAQPIVTFVTGAAATEGFADLQRVTDLTFQVILVVAIAINVTKLFVDGWRLIRGR
ncbi:HAAS signaling domain-containing protein [Caulobacter sp. RL271]|jgi:hypothetical protein|uniref:Uncharacterized protein n=1 Tax=Caulobacter segnis TaxID=88688 RepID=A0ABY4ZR49_9CAUL|nr:hypothetical protein [Caulobacter segnis]USQ94990.1 hypothetical protein MZV50_20880 [Caulobacter segnis]